MKIKFRSLAKFAIGFSLAVSTHLTGEGIALAQTQGADLRSEVPIRNRSVAVIDASNEALRGSATRVCTSNLQDTSGKMYYVTAAHVIERNANVRTENGTALTVERIDSCADIALLSAPMGQLQFAVPGCVDLPLFMGQSYPTAYDVSSILSERQYPLALEGLDPSSRTVRRYEFQSPLAYSRSRGLPGRECTGPLILARGQAIQGNSGGAIFKVEPERAVGFGSRDRLVGMILAVDPGPNGTETVLLPAAVISEFVNLGIQGLQRQASRIEERRVEGGIEYLDSGAIHYRSGRVSHLDSSVASAIPAGPGGRSDGGPGGTSDGGPGGRSDGGSGEARPIFSSGIVTVGPTPNTPNRRWLSIGDFWSESEPYPRERRAILREPSRVEGIYEENGHLIATSASTPLPSLFEGVPPGVQGCAWSEMVNQRPDAHGAAVKTRVLVCSRSEPGKSTFALAIPNGAGTFETYRIQLTRHCAESCAVSARGLKQTLRGVPRNASPEDLERRIDNIPEAGAVELDREGLRTFSNSNISIHVESTGGFRLERKAPSGEISVVTGPATTDETLPVYTFEELRRGVENQLAPAQNLLRCNAH